VFESIERRVVSSKRHCPACGAASIKGVRVFFAARTGARNATVCQRCADGGLLVVQDKTGDLAKCTMCERNPAVVCLACCVPRKVAK
jgi:hypothetical protein